MPATTHPAPAKVAETVRSALFGDNLYPPPVRVGDAPVVPADQFFRTAEVIDEAVYVALRTAMPDLPIDLHTAAAACYGRFYAAMYERDALTGDYKRKPLPGNAKWTVTAAAATK